MFSLFLATSPYANESVAFNKQLIPSSPRRETGTPTKYNVLLSPKNLYPEQNLDLFRHFCRDYGHYKQRVRLDDTPRYGITGHNSPHLMHSLSLNESRNFTASLAVHLSCLMTII